MAEIQYEAGDRRLRLVGACTRDDRGHVSEALGTFGRMAGGELVVDLTAASELDREVALVLVEAARRAQVAGDHWAIVRGEDSEIDRMLNVIMAEVHGTRQPDE